MNGESGQGTRSPALDWLPALAWAAALLILGGQESAGPSLPAGLDKVAHLSLYGVLGLLSGHGWVRHGRSPAAALVLILAMAIGALDEMNQSRVPGRDADPFDFLADAIGVLLGFAARLRLGARRNRTTNV